MIASILDAFKSGAEEKKEANVSKDTKKDNSAFHFRWFHGKISRDKAEELLDPRVDGLFLVRESIHYPGDYTLSVCKQNIVEHYRIIFKDNKLTIDEESYFNNLNELVEVF